MIRKYCYLIIPIPIAVLPHIASLTSCLLQPKRDLQQGFLYQFLVRVYRHLFLFLVHIYVDISFHEREAVLNCATVTYYYSYKLPKLLYLPTSHLFP